MKVLIYDPFCLWKPHFGTDLEIANRHLENGDEVHFLRCSGDLLTCEPNPDHLESTCMLCKSSFKRGMGYINIPKKNIHELFLTKFTQKVNLPKFSSINELKEYKIGNVDFGMAVAASLISRIREPEPDMNPNMKIVEKDAMTSVAVYYSVKYYLRKIKPDVFYVFNGRFAALRPALRAAQSSGIKTFVHERAGVLQKYSLAEDTYPHDIEYQKKQIEMCWDNNSDLDEKKKVAVRWFENRRKGQDQSWYSFTKSQKSNALPESFDISKRNIAIFNSSEDEFAAIAGWQNPIYNNQNDAVKQIINANVDKNIRFHLRIHPNLKNINNSQTTELRNLSAPNLIVIPADSEVDSYELADKCEKIITFGSTMGIEAVYSIKPSILVGRSLYEGLSSTYIPTNHNELIYLINADLKPGNIVGALKYGYWQETQGHVYEKYLPLSVMDGKFLNKPLGPKYSTKMIYKAVQLKAKLFNMIKSLFKLGMDKSI